MIFFEVKLKKLKRSSSICYEVLLLNESIEDQIYDEGKTTMPALEPLCHLLGVSTKGLTKEECFLLEADLLTQICDHLKEVFREDHKRYFNLLKFTKEKEDCMLEAKFFSLIIHDILSTNDYTLEGIANYTDFQMDVIQEVYVGQNSNPSALLLRRLIELHKVVRRELYLHLTHKIKLENQLQTDNEE